VTAPRIDHSSTALETPASCRVYTPPRLAAALVRALGDEPDALWLEPCVGKGALLSALSEYGVSASRIVAIDVDAGAERSDGLAETLRGTEFLAWASATDVRFQRIIANPPFLSLGLAPKAVRAAAIRHVAPDGSQVTLGGNLWYAFLCASLRILAPGGAIAFILPAAWDYADYALPLRRTIAGLFETVVVHRSQLPLFADVQDGSVVLVASGYQYRARRYERLLHRTADRLVSALESTAPTSAHLPALSLIDPTPSVDGDTGSELPRFTYLRDILSIKLGGVTGQVKYFLMTEPERRNRRLPVAAMHRVVTHAAHLSTSELTTKDWARLRTAGERVWLFRPGGKIRENAAVRRYIGLPTGKGGCNRSGHKISIRKPWYQTPLPRNIHGFMSGMTNAGPWICLSAARGVSATNTLYVVTFNKSVSAAMRPPWALAMLSTPARNSIRGRARHYADGLMKFEPGDLLGAMVPVPERSTGASEAYSRAVEALLDGREAEASMIADEWLGLSP
jgi:adenine-specific DNA-methyltransferase